LTYSQTLNRHKSLYYCLKFNVLNNRIEFLFLVGRGLVSRLGDVGSTVS